MNRFGLPPQFRAERVFVCAMLALTAGCMQSEHRAAASQPAQPVVASRAVPIIDVDGYRFRDLDRDGHLTPYEDWRLSASVRADDLVARMTIEEKAGALLHPVLGELTQVTEHNINSVLTRSGGGPQELAKENNALQMAAESTRLAIPMTVSSDPRYVFKGTFGMSVETEGFTKWPDSPGFGAIGDTELTRQFARIVAQEYRAVGIGMALSPQADVATDPRWARVSGTFGEDFETVGQQAAAYIEGIQGGDDGVMPGGVAAVVKHFTGYGAAKDGWDSHSRYGRFSTYPGGRFDDHLTAFRPSFKVKVAGVMPTYSILDLPGHPPVGGAFNKVLITDILRQQEGFDGLVLSDWSVTEDCKGPCLGEPLGADRKGLVGKPWGVEELSRDERIAMTLKAGVDQIGYDTRDVDVDSSPIIEAVSGGRLPIARIDEAVRRIMIVKFQSGLFEAPFVDVERVNQIVGQPQFRQAALEAQQRSLVLLENKGSLLPVEPAGQRVYLRGIDKKQAEQAGFVVVEELSQAELAIVRAVAPWQSPHMNYLFGRFQHEGDLDFKADNADLKAIREISAQVPTVVTVYLERPAILTNVREHAAAMIGNFGVSDEALLNVVTGRAKPSGKLPFELPSSMAAAAAQKSDVPHDSVDPLYPIGYGLSY